jgi:anti-sigma B factor antagonist
MHGEGLIAALSNENAFELWPERPEFALQFSRQDAHVLVAVEGELDADSAPMLQQRLSDLIESQGNLSIVVDLRSTTFIDSSGLTVLVTAHNWLQARGGQLRLFGPRRSAHKVLQISGLHRLLTIVQD